MTPPEFVRNPTRDDYREAAAVALEQGDSEQAASMISAALAMDPRNEACLALLDRVLEMVKDPLGLFDPTKDAFFGRVAVRARVLARQGRVLEALRILARVVTFRPEVAYLTWVPEWFKRAQLPANETPSRAIDWQPLLSALGSAEQGPRRENAEAAADILAWLVERYPSDDALLVLYVQWLHQIEQHERVLTDLRRLDATQPSYVTRLLLGRTKRRMGLLEPCVQSFADAAAMKPDQSSLWLELGDAQLEAGMVEPALNAYARALELEPNGAWARASRSYVSSVRTQDLAQKEDLRAQCQHEPRARELLLDAEFVEHRLGFPETPGTRVLFDFCRRIRGSNQSEVPKLHLRVTNPEPPSFYRAFQLTTQALDLANAELEITADGPLGLGLDPARPGLWDYAKCCPKPLLPRPNDETVRAVAAIAATTPSGIASYYQGAAALSFSSEQLACAAFYAPAPPSRAISPLEWLFGFQVLCLLGIARSEQDWVGSARRRWLYDLAAGHVDWISAAAMIALGVVLKDNVQAAPEIQRWFQQWLKASPADAPHCYERHLVASWMRATTPSTEDEQRLWQRRIALRPRLQ
ncbi:MAG: hypothetical protein ACM3ZE_05380 [Myxococcales bacterium]